MCRRNNRASPRYDFRLILSLVLIKPNGVNPRAWSADAYVTFIDTKGRFKRSNFLVQISNFQMSKFQKNGSWRFSQHFQNFEKIWNDQLTKMWKNVEATPTTMFLKFGNLGHLDRNFGTIKTALRGHVIHWKHKCGTGWVTLPFS